MPFDFEKIARRALDQGSVDDPTPSDIDEESTLDSMERLKKTIDDLCVDASNNKGLDAADIICVLCSILAKGIVTQTSNAIQAVKLFRDVTACISDGVYLALQKKEK